MQADHERYDVVIVGGRPAGAGLAARLGARGVSTLVFDRAEFPSLPAVPSAPVLYPSGMRLLDEIGIDERAYLQEGATMRAFFLEFGDWFSARLSTVLAFGRDVVAGIDRRSFDHALWKNLARFPSVTARLGLSFVDLVRDDDGRVIGVDVRAEDGSTQRILAGVVVGADGRFSSVARKASARIVEDHPDHTSTVHFADWEGIEPFDDSGETVALIHATGRGIDFPHIPMPGGVIGVSVHARSDRAEIGGDAEEYYLATLKRYPRVWKRFARAKMVTPVLGVKKIANRYHQAGGPGWVLVGDALHHKDPVDGQGIYDALIEGKVLAEALLSVREGRRTEGEALALYEERVREETHGMFLATLDRLKRELYDEPPEMVIKTLLRWLITDPEYQRRFVLFLFRAIPPEGWLPPSLMRDAAVRGALRDLRDRVLGGAGEGAKPRLGGAAG